MKLKIILMVIFLSSTTDLFSQEIYIGRYESEQGSVLNIKKNNSFEYFRSNHKIEGNQIYALDFSYKSKGKFKEKSNLLILDSEELTIKNGVKEEGLSLSIQELQAAKNNFPDSISIKVNFDSNLLNLYMCDTPLEDIDFLGSCLKLSNNNKIELFKGEFIIRIYPNFDNPKNRLLKQKTIYYDTEKFKKKDFFSDLEIDLEFDTKYFNYEYFKQEIMVIEDGKIYHEGQEFMLQN